MRVAFWLSAMLLVTLAQGQSQTDALKIRDEMLDSGPVASPQVPDESTASNRATDARQDAKEILDSPLYRDSPESQQGESWLSEAFKKIGDRIAKMFERKDQKSGGAMPALPILDVLIYLVIGVIVAALIGFAAFAISQIRWKSRSKSDVDGGLLDESEVGRSSDEWIDQADRLAREGDYRAAVRCLYLACLTRLDESHVLRFERNETNWEHLSRYQDLAVKPGGFDFRPATQRFDLAWYGLVPQGPDDLDWFKSEYRQLLHGLRGGN